MGEGPERARPQTLAEIGRAGRGDAPKPSAADGAAHGRSRLLVRPVHVRRAT